MNRVIEGFIKDVKNQHNQDIFVFPQTEIKGATEAVDIDSREAKQMLTFVEKKIVDEGYIFIHSHYWGQYDEGRCTQVYFIHPDLEIRHKQLKDEVMELTDRIGRAIDPNLLALYRLLEECPNKVLELWAGTH